MSPNTPNSNFENKQILHTVNKISVTSVFVHAVNLYGVRILNLVFGIPLLQLLRSSWVFVIAALVIAIPVQFGVYWIFEKLFYKPSEIYAEYYSDNSRMWLDATYHIDDFSNGLLLVVMVSLVVYVSTRINLLQIIAASNEIKPTLSIIISNAKGLTLKYIYTFILLLITAFGSASLGFLYMFLAIKIDLIPSSTLISYALSFIPLVVYLVYSVYTLVIVAVERVGGAAAIRRSGQLFLSKPVNTIIGIIPVVLLMVPSLLLPESYFILTIVMYVFISPFIFTYLYCLYYFVSGECDTENFLSFYKAPVYPLAIFGILVIATLVYLILQLNAIINFL